MAQGFGLPDYLQVAEPDNGSDELPQLIEPSDIEADKEEKELKEMNVLEIKAILFDGDHRNNEIQMP